MIKNEDGEVKCLTEKGNIRWLAEHIATDSYLMKTMGLIVAPSPRKLEPIIEEITTVNDNIEIETKVAEAVVADKPRKQKTK